MLLLGVAGGAWGLLRRRGEHPAAAPIQVPQPVGITVEVLNGSGRRGLARTATRVLREQGFDVLTFGTLNDTVRVTEVLARRGDSLAAARVVKALGVGMARVALDTLLRLDVTVRLGADYAPPPAIRP